MASGRAKTHAILGFAAVFGAFLGVAGIIYADILLLGNLLDETSLTEIFQAAMILASAVLFGFGAMRVPASRGYLIVMATLFLSMFIRENDRVLDTIWHGFWIVPVLGVFIAGAVLARRAPGTTIAGWLAHVRHGSFWIVMIGLIQLIVFSRLFGSGGLWENVPGLTEVNLTKTIVQEGIELVSYAILLFGAGLSAATGFGAAHRGTQS